MKFTLIIFLLFLNSHLQAQDEMYTKDLQNGYYWHSLNSPIPFSNPKHYFLSGMLERYNILKLATNKDHLSDCRDELTRLQEEKKSDLIDIELVVQAINEFYSNKNSLSIPIINAYCYCIKEIADVNKEELTRYKNKITERYRN